MNLPLSETTNVVVGQEVVVTVAHRMRDGSLISVQPGDVGRVVRVTEQRCTAQFFGADVDLPLAVVSPLGRPAADGR